MRASGQVVVGENTRIYAHWGSRREDGTMVCSCGWTSDGPVEFFEVYFLAHAQVEMTNLVLDEQDHCAQRRDAEQLTALRELHASPSPAIRSKQSEPA